MVVEHNYLFIQSVNCSIQRTNNYQAAAAAAAPPRCSCLCSCAAAAGMTEGAGSKTITCCLVLIRSGRSKQVFSNIDHVGTVFTLNVCSCAVKNAWSDAYQAGLLTQLTTTHILTVLLCCCKRHTLSNCLGHNLLRLICVCVTRTAWWVAFTDTRHEYTVIAVANHLLLCMSS